MRTINPSDAFGLAIIAQETVAAVCQGRNISDGIIHLKLRIPAESGIVGVMQTLFNNVKTKDNRSYRVKQFFKSAEALGEYSGASDDEKAASAVLLWSFGNNEMLYNALKHNLDIDLYLKS